MVHKKILAFTLIIITLFTLFCNSFSVFADECEHDFDSFANDDNTHILKCVNCGYTTTESCTYSEDEFGEWYCSTCGARQLESCQHSYHYTAQYNNYHNATCTLCGIVLTEPCVYNSSDVCYLCGANKPTHQHDFDITSNNNGTHTHTCLSCGHTITEPCDFYFDKTDTEYYCYVCGEQKPDCYHDVIYISNNDGTHQRKCTKCEVSQKMECTYQTDKWGNEKCVLCNYTKQKEPSLNDKYYQSVIPWQSIMISDGTDYVQNFWCNTFNYFPLSYTLSQQYPTITAYGNIVLSKVSGNAYDTHANSGYYLAHALQNTQEIMYKWTAFDFIDRTTRSKNSYPYIRLGSGARVADNSILRTITASISYVVYTAVIDENGVPSTRVQQITFPYTKTELMTGDTNIYLSENFIEAIENDFKKKGFDKQFTYIGEEYVVNTLETSCKVTYNKTSSADGKEMQIIYNDFYQMPLNVSTKSWYEKAITKGNEYILLDVDTEYVEQNWFEGVLKGAEAILNTKLIGNISIGSILTICVSIGLLLVFLKIFTG